MSTNKVSLSDQQSGWIKTAQSKINPQRLQQLTEDLTAIHSPTGGEREASEFMVEYMRNVGMDASYQAVNELSGNCIGRIKGSGEGPSLMLYAPIDTFLEGENEADVPWVGPELRDDMLPSAYSKDGMVYGLGSSNPKSMLSTIVEAATTVLESGAELKGDLIVASCGGGMPWIVKERHNVGMSSGVMYMLSHGMAPDYCLIFKPGDEVYWEHPGLCWFKSDCARDHGLRRSTKRHTRLSKFDSSCSGCYKRTRELVADLSGKSSINSNPTRRLDCRSAFWLAGKTRLPFCSDRNLSRYSYQPKPD